MSTGRLRQKDDGGADLGISARGSDIEKIIAPGRLASSGADIKTIQEYSGHESLQMVMRNAHAQDRAVDLALDRLEREHPVNKSGGRS
jgi:hypothetical protein